MIGININRLAMINIEYFLSTFRFPKEINLFNYCNNKSSLGLEY